MVTKRKWYTYEQLNIRRAAERVGGLRKLSKMMNVSHNTIAKWSRVPAEKVPEFERLTGMPRHVLRPDLWDDPERERELAAARKRQSWAALDEGVSV